MDELNQKAMDVSHIRMRTCSLYDKIPRQTLATYDDQPQHRHKLSKIEDLLIVIDKQRMVV